MEFIYLASAPHIARPMLAWMDGQEAHLGGSNNFKQSLIQVESSGIGVTTVLFGISILLTFVTSGYDRKVPNGAQCPGNKYSLLLDDHPSDIYWVIPI